MASGGSPSDPYRFISNILEQRLNSYQAWPANIFKLECEGYDLYQNATGNVLNELLEEGAIGKTFEEIHDKDRPFITRPDADSAVEEPEVIDATTEVYDFLTDNGHFADLAAYVALCKIYDELHSHIQLDILPEGPRPNLLHYPGRDPDGLIMLPTEYVPVEVYNGRDYLGTNGRKYNQLTDLASFEFVDGELREDEQLNSHPFLINRRCDQDLKNAVRKRNGMVVDTDCIIACEETYPDIDDALQMFNLTPLVHRLPRLETDDGIALDGDKYIDISGNTGEDGILRPPSKLVAAADELPDQYIRRIRGGVQLQYVNSFYRRVSGRTRREACLVLQTIYNQLLREGGWDEQIALDEGWTEMREQYRRIKSPEQRKDMILEETRNLLNTLREEDLISERNGGLHARKSTHPQQSLSF